MEEFWQELARIDWNLFPYPTEQNEKRGLTEFVQLVLGLPLNKAMQFTMWNNRKLREEQIKYAALDAYCLIETYEEIRDQLQSQTNDFDSIVNNFMCKGIGRSIGPSIGQPIEQPIGQPIGPPIDPPVPSRSQRKRRNAQANKKRKLEEAEAEEDGGVLMDNFFMG